MGSWRPVERVPWGSSAKVNSIGFEPALVPSIVAHNLKPGIHDALNANGIRAQGYRTNDRQY
jgi:hypothetical protein